MRVLSAMRIPVPPHGADMPGRRALADMRRTGALRHAECIASRKAQQRPAMSCAMSGAPRSSAHAPCQAHRARLRCTPFPTHRAHLLHAPWQAYRAHLRFAPWQVYRAHLLRAPRPTYNAHLRYVPCQAYCARLRHAPRPTYRVHLHHAPCQANRALRTRSSAPCSSAPCAMSSVPRSVHQIKSTAFIFTAPIPTCIGRAHA